LASPARSRSHSRGQRAVAEPSIALPIEPEHTREVAEAITTWFPAAARELPWRKTPRDPYHALVAEAMLQQTQVSRVVGKFTAFVERFPSVASLAEAPLDDVLSMWTGLGYYRRARNLHAAARLIVERFAGHMPSSLDHLLELPGVGRYTAGAIRSIAFNLPAPIVDGNVARVLLRIHGVDAASNDPEVQPWLWQSAGALSASAQSPAIVNEGLMELGATICLPAPAEPRCLFCPVAGYCRAQALGLQASIPRPKPSSARSVIHCAVALITRASGEVLIEQRPETGMWAGLWQAPTLESVDKPPTRAALTRAVGLPARALAKVTSFSFLATHRELRFAVYSADVHADFQPARGSFTSPAAIRALGVSSPQQRILIAGTSNMLSP
jgi:A/G-specific adenine glycosylase